MPIPQTIPTAGMPIPRMPRPTIPTIPVQNPLIPHNLFANTLLYTSGRAKTAQKVLNDRLHFQEVQKQNKNKKKKQKKKKTRRSIQKE